MPPQCRQVNISSDVRCAEWGNVGADLRAANRGNVGADLRAANRGNVEMRAGRPRSRVMG
jgi:hypothetical protein